MKDKELVEIPLSEAEFNRITKNKTSVKYGMDNDYTKEKCDCFMQSLKKDTFNNLTVTKKTYSIPNKPNSYDVIISRIYGTCNACDTEYRFILFIDREKWEKEYKDKDE